MAERMVFDDLRKSMGKSLIWAHEPSFQRPDKWLECRGFLKMLQVVSRKGLAPKEFTQV